MTDVPKDFHTGSGNAQDKSTRGSDCASRVGPISIATDATRVDRATEVETGVNTTCSTTGRLVCQYCGRDNFRRGAGLAQHQKALSAPNVIAPSSVHVVLEDTSSPAKARCAM